MKTNKLIYICVGIAVLAALLYLATKEASAPSPSGDLVACTADAVQCPDGSYVGRTGLDCEFVCPDTEAVESVTNPDIQVDAPAVGTTVSSPLVLSGQAKGTWYFEASAPVVIEDTNGTVLGQGFVTAQGNWMTTNLVPFTGNVAFTVPAGVTNGFVIFKKDNPSGEPQFDDEIAIPVQF